MLSFSSPRPPLLPRTRRLTLAALRPLSKHQQFCTKERMRVWTTSRKQPSIYNRGRLAPASDLAQPRLAPAGTAWLQSNRGLSLAALIDFDNHHDCPDRRIEVGAGLIDLWRLDDHMFAQWSHQVLSDMLVEHSSKVSQDQRLLSSVSTCAHASSRQQAPETVPSQLTIMIDAAHQPTLILSSVDRLWQVMQQVLRHISAPYIRS